MVSVLEGSVILAVFLDGIVGQMDEVVIDILGWKGLSGGAYEGLFEEVDGEVVSKENPGANVKFTVVD